MGRPDFHYPREAEMTTRSPQAAAVASRRACLPGRRPTRRDNEWKTGALSRSHEVGEDVLCYRCSRWRSAIRRRSASRILRVRRSSSPARRWLSTSISRRRTPRWRRRRSRRGTGPARSESSSGRSRSIRTAKISVRTAGWRSRRGDSTTSEVKVTAKPYNIGAMVTQYTTALDGLPLWGLFLTIVVLVLAAIEGGYRLGSYRHRQEGREKEAPVGAMVGATLGLLAFMLAFTFGMAASRFDTRKQLVLDEANAIGTTYLRTAMLPERRDEIRTLLRSYVDARLEAVRSGRVAEQIVQSEHIQGQLWSAATAVGLQHPDSIVVGLFVESLNEVIDLHAKRVTAGLRNRIPSAIWVALLTIAALSLAAMGYHAGLVGTIRSLAIIVVAVTFSAVIVLIADLDRPQEGTLIVSQQALIDVRESMNPSER